MIITMKNMIIVMKKMIIQTSQVRSNRHLRGGVAAESSLQCYSWQQEWNHPGVRALLTKQSCESVNLTANKSHPEVRDIIQELEEEVETVDSAYAQLLKSRQSNTQVDLVLL